MKSNRLNTQILSIFLIIIAAFVGSAMFFSYLNTNSIRQSVETETRLSSAILSSALRSGLSETMMREQNNPSADTFPILDGRLKERLTTAISQANNEVGEDLDMWVVDDSRRILYEKTIEGGKGLDELLPDALWQKLVKSRSEGGDGDSNSVLLWVGEQKMFLLNQQLVMVRSVFEDDSLLENKLYLVMLNRGMSVLAMQRQHFALFVGIEIVLMISMIVVLANTLFSYRKQLIRLATKDELTGLSNRKSFNETYREYIKKTDHDKAGPFTVFLIDVDFFKQINDTYGHAAGDLALRTLAGHIGRLVDRFGGFAGRWGGDEFIGVLPISQEEAEPAIRRLCEDLRTERLEGDFRITLSVGAAQAERSESPELSVVTELADLALYVSKENGRDQATFYSKELESVSGMQPQEETIAKEKSGIAAGAGKGDRQTSAEVSAAVPGTKSAVKARTVGSRLKTFVRDKLVKSILLGVKWMAPFVAGGGLLIGLAFLFDAFSVDLASLSVAERTHLGSITPIAASLKSIGDSTFNFMLPVFAGFMAYGLAGESAFLPGFVGGFMTINSNSGFIGAMIAGLVAGVIAYEMNEFIWRMPRFIQKAAPIVIFPIFNLLLMHVIAILVITPIASSLEYVFLNLLTGLSSLDHNLSGAVAGGMMAVDMGGIINKVAYNYGVSGLESGRTAFMASVMAGGMVPPIGIALSMLLFKNKFSSEDRERTASTLFMGLSFITEGALPFVFSDLVRVIPSCIVGSALAGLLSTLYGCELPAPHGGLFVLPVMTHPLLYLIALGAGSCTTAIILGYLKKDIEKETEKEAGKDAA